MSIKVKNWMGEYSYLGPSKALVVDNKDPSFKGRIKVLSPVFGETGYIHYIYPEDGFFSPPDIGSVVLVETDGGDPNYIVARGTINDGDKLNPDTRVELRRSVPTNRGWSTPGDLDALGKPLSTNGGHLIELDDGLAIDNNGNVTHTKESKGFRVSTLGGHFLRMWEEETDGTQKNRIELGTSGGHSFFMADEAGKTSNQQRIEFKTTGNQYVQLIDEADSQQQQVIIKDADLRTIEIIKSSDRIRIRNSSNTIHIDIDLANDTIEVDAKIVKLGTNATEHLVRGDAFRTLFNMHTHPTPAGPSLKPFEQMDPSSANTHLSKEHMVE